MTRAIARPAFPTLLIAALAAAPAGAILRQLSDGQPFSAVQQHVQVAPRFSPDGRFAVFVQDADLDGAEELWSARVAGGAPSRLSGVLPAGASVARFEITADSQRVVFTSPEDGGGQELYSVPIAGGSAIELSQPLASGHVVEFAVTPDGERVAYVGAFTTPDQLELWAIDVDGAAGSRDQLLAPLPAGRVLGRIRFALDRVFFLAEVEAGKVELWRSALDGGGAARLSGARVVPTEIDDFWITVDGFVTVFHENRDLGLPDRVELLYRVPSLGGAEALVAGALHDDLDIRSVQLSPDGNWIGFLADLDVDDLQELWSVPITGGAPVQLNSVMVPGGNVADFRFVPQSTRVVYRADQELDTRLELYSVAPAGGAVVNLNGDLVPGSDVAEYTIHPQSAWVAYVADQDGPGHEVRGVSPFGGAAVLWSERPLFLSSTSAGNLGFSPDGSYLFFEQRPCVTFPTPGCQVSIRAYDLGAELIRVVFAMPAGEDLLTLPEATVDHGVLALYEPPPDGGIELFLAAPCLFCDGFESGDTGAWSQ